MKHVRVGHINLRLRGISLRLARSAIPGLSHQIRRQLPRQGISRRAGSSRHINQINPSPIQIRAGVHTAELNRKIAQAIANSIAQDSEQRF
jgi:hypothetical protein